MTWPTVSIVIPAWNAEQWIARAVRSYVLQEYPGGPEIIVADDGSTDGTKKLVEQIRLRWGGRIALLEGPHVGYAHAFNRALAAASGDVIARQDADDWSTPDRLRKSVEALTGGKAWSGDIVSSEMALVDETGKRTGETHVGGMVEAEYLKGHMIHGPCSPTLVAWKRTYDVVGPFTTDPRWKWSPDSEWNFRALRAGARWLHLPEPLYYYRRHPGQMTAMSLGKCHLAYVDLIQEHLKAKGLPA